MGTIIAIHEDSGCLVWDEYGDGRAVRHVPCEPLNRDFRKIMRRVEAGESVIDHPTRGLTAIEALAICRALELDALVEEPDDLRAEKGITALGTDEARAATFCDQEAEHDGKTPPKGAARTNQVNALRAEREQCARDCRAALKKLRG